MEYDAIALIHKGEKEKLRILEETVDYKINNPELNSQREVVNKLKDKLILIEESRTFVPMTRKCMFSNCVNGQKNPNCHKTMKYTLKQYVTFGNCCKSCNSILEK